MAGAADTEGDSDAPGNGERYRLLVLAGEAVAGPELRRQIGWRVGDRPATVHVVSPALTDTGFEHAMGDVDDAVAAAQERLGTSVEEIRRTGAEVTGEVIRAVIAGALGLINIAHIVGLVLRAEGFLTLCRGFESHRRHFSVLR
jgi:hypothetical protein